MPEVRHIFHISAESGVRMRHKIDYEKFEVVLCLFPRIRERWLQFLKDVRLACSVSKKRKKIIYSHRRLMRYFLIGKYHITLKDTFFDKTAQEIRKRALLQPNTCDGLRLEQEA